MTEQDVDPLVAKLEECPRDKNGNTDVLECLLRMGEAANLLRSQAELTAERDRLRENVRDLAHKKRVTAQFRDEFKSRAEAAEARLTDALAALEPFAAAYDRCAPEPHEIEMYGAAHPDSIADDKLAMTFPTLGDLRNARATFSRLTAAEKKGGEPFPQPDRNRKGKEPCGECHIQPGETCDICGASASEVHATLQGEAAETLSNTIEMELKQKPFRLTVSIQSSNPLHYGWRSMKERMFSSLDEAISETEGISGALKVRVHEAMNIETWMKNGRWQQRYYRAVAKAGGGR